MKKGIVFIVYESLGILLFVYFITYLMIFNTGCEDIREKRLNAIDNDFIIENGNELIPAILPWVVVVSANDDIELWKIAIEETNNAFDDEYFIYDESIDYLDVTNQSTQNKKGIITTNKKFIENHIRGKALLYLNRSQEITTVEITINEQWDYGSNRCRIDIRKHEIGHTFGLIDDPGRPHTVDLNSCMSDPTPCDCDFTLHDIDLVNNRYYLWR